MRKLKVVTTFIRLPPVDKASFCHNVIVKMTNNLLFTDPDVSLEEALDALNAFDAAILAAKDGGHTPISIRNDCEKVVNAKFSILAKYVDRIANGDETTILSSGFAECKQPSIPAREAFTVTDGVYPGSIHGRCIPTDNAGAYVWQIREAGTTVWVTHNTTQSSIDIFDLIINTVYELQVGAVTKDGLQPFSVVVSKLVV